MASGSGFDVSIKTSDVENTSSIKKFFSGVILLSAANIVVKAIGLLFKIPLQHVIGDEGMGYFNSAYTIYAWLYMLATAGIPVAISIVVSENRAKKNGSQIKRVFRISVILLTVIGFFATGMMILLAKPLASLIGASSSYYCIIAVAPTLLFISVSSAIRGYFQGFQNMVPTAVSQVLEAFGKLIVGLLLAIWASKNGFSLPEIAAYAGFGITVGAVAGMLSLIVSKCLSSKEKTFEFENKGASSPKIISRLMDIAVPVTISSSVMSLTNLIDLGVVVNRLESIGYSESAAMAVYGNYTTLVVPMFNLPPILIYPIAYSIVPIISESVSSENHEKIRKVLTAAIKLAAIIALPCAVGLAVMAYPILSVLFSPASAELGAPMLVLLAPAVFFMCILAVTNSALQALGKVKLPIISMLFGAAVKITVSYLLTGNPDVGIYGTPIGTFACYLAAAAFNLFYIIKETDVDLGVKKTYVKPFIAAFVSCFGAAFVYRCLPLEEISSLTLSVCAAAVVYFTVIFVLGGVTESELALFFKNRKIISFMKNINLLKK